MARKMKVELVDDLDGGEATQTVPFHLDGVAYEIDLSDMHAEALRAALAPFVAAARRSGRLQRGGAARVAPPRRRESAGDARDTIHPVLVDEDRVFHQAATNGAAVAQPTANGLSPEVSS
jgi:hypothetical protein